MLSIIISVIWDVRGPSLSQGLTRTLKYPWKKNLLDARC